MRAGATAYVAKSSPAKALAEAVDEAASAEPFVDPAARSSVDPSLALTRRQREILQLFANGYSPADVARRLGLSGETVRTHTRRRCWRAWRRGTARTRWRSVSATASSTIGGSSTARVEDPRCS